MFEPQKLFTKNIFYPLLSGAALFTFTFLIYLPALTGDFTYDDTGIIKNDSYIHDPRNIIDVLTGL